MTRDRQGGAASSDGFAITRVGVIFAAVTVMLVAAATNTGNNGLFLVVAVMLAVLVVGGLMASHNLRRLSASMHEVREIFAKTPLPLPFTLRHGGRWLPRWLLLVSLDPRDMEPAPDPPRRPSPHLVPLLAAGKDVQGYLELMIRRRGLHRIRALHVVSLFPFGIFRKGRHLPVDLEILVYPEVFTAATARPADSGRLGEDPRPQAGQGQDLHSLREYRPGDDPRHIHWKRSAREDRLIYLQRETDASRRLAILFDNAVGTNLTEDERTRFERLVSEAATAALDYLDDGYEVALITRGDHLPYASGGRQRKHILEILALVEPVVSSREPLRAPVTTERSLELSMASPVAIELSNDGRGTDQPAEAVA